MTFIIKKPFFDGEKLVQKVEEVERSTPVERGVVVEVGEQNLVISEEFINFYAELFKKIIKESE